MQYETGCVNSLRSLNRNRTFSVLPKPDIPHVTNTLRADG
jgi:hypothetical protein